MDNPVDHPRPWHTTRFGTGWVVMDADGCHLANGLSLHDAERIVSAVNHKWEAELAYKPRDDDK